MSSIARRIAAAAALGLGLTAAAPAFADGPFTLLESTADRVVLEYRSPGPSIETVDTPAGRFQAVGMPGHTGLEQPGRPNLPTRSAGLAVPPGADPVMSFEILATEEIPGIRPLPAGEAPAFDRAVYDGTAVWPAEAAVYRDLGWLRHQRAGQVSIQPLRWDPVRNSLERIVRARITVRFTRSATAPGRDATLPVGEEPAWEDTYRNVFLNYDAARSFRVRALPALRAPSPSPRALGENTEFRLYIEDSGIYYVTYQRLSAAGWPAGIPVNQIRFYEKSPNVANPSQPVGREIPIRVEEGTSGQAGVFDGDDVFYIYGQGFEDRLPPRVEDARYTRLHTYWVSWSEAGGARMEETPGWYDAAGFRTPDTFYRWTHYEEEKVYTFFPVSEGTLPGQPPRYDVFFWLDRLAYRDSLTFDASGIAPGTKARVRVSWRGGTAPTHYLTVWLTRNCAAPSDTLLLNRGTFGGFVRYNYDSGPVIPAARFSDGCNRLKYQGNGSDGNDPNSPGSGAYLDWFEIGYERRYEAKDGRLRFTTGARDTGDVEFSIGGFGQRDLYAFDVTDSLNPRVVDLSGASIVQESPPPSPKYRLKFRARTAAPRTYEVFTASGLRDLAEAVRPGHLPPAITSSVLVRDAGEDAAMDAGANVLVLCHPEFRAELERWVSHRQGQGYTIRVVSPQDVWNEFSGGDMSVPAIREWARWCYRNWTNPPDYLVLFGDGSEDYRNDRGESKTDWVPTWMAFSPEVLGGAAELIGSDGYFVGALAPGDNDLNILPEMHIGRIPAGSVDEARIIVDKLIAYDQYGPADDWRNRGLIVSDDLYSNPVRGGSTYCYYSSNSAFGRGADTVRVELARNACLSDFSVEEFRLSTWLDTLAQAPRTFRTGDCANLSATQSYTVSKLRPLWLQAASRGHLFHIYSGHANKSVMTSELLVQDQGQFTDPDNRTVENLTNSGRPFIFIGLACHLNEFEYYDEKLTKWCLGERMLMLPTTGAIASIASTGYENIYSNWPVEQYFTRALFTDLPLDPDTGHPRRILGEGKDQGLIRLIMEQGEVVFGSLPQSYTLLGDPTMPIDMAPPRFRVTAAGQPVDPGAVVTAEPGGSTLTISARVDDDVAAGPFSILDDSTSVPSSLITVTPADDGACAASTIRYTAELKPATYAIVLRSEDWRGRPTEFPLNVRLAVEYRVNGVRLSAGQEAPVDGVYTVRIESPVALAPERVEVTVDGQGGLFGPAAADETGRLLTLESTGPLPSGAIRLETRIDGQVARSTGAALSVTVRSGASLGGAWFYPNPWEGSGDPFFTYELTYLAGEHPKRAQVSVFTVSGRRVRRFDAPVELGTNRVNFDMRDDSGDVLANGVYLWKLSIETADGRMLTRIDRLVVHR